MNTCDCGKWMQRISQDIQELSVVISTKECKEDPVWFKLVAESIRASRKWAKHLQKEHGDHLTTCQLRYSIG